MKCKHTEFKDLGDYWQCADCARTVKKETVQETQDRIDQLKETMADLQWIAPTNEIEQLAQRLDKVQAELDKDKHQNNPYN